MKAQGVEAIAGIELYEHKTQIIKWKHIITPFEKRAKNRAYLLTSEWANRIW
jgi:hypothetical protein